MSNDFNLSFIKHKTTCHLLSRLEIVCFFHYEPVHKGYYLLISPVVCQKKEKKRRKKLVFLKYIYRIRGSEE